MAHEFERLCDLHHDDGHDGKPDADDIDLPGQIFAAEAEHRHDARREHDERDERERDERDDVEELVRERPHFEEGVPRTHVVGVERLREGEHEEGSGRCSSLRATVLRTYSLAARSGCRSRGRRYFRFLSAACGP